MFARLQPFMFTFALAGLITYFVFHGLTGELGWMLSAQRKEELKQRNAEFIHVHQQRMDLEARARLLRDGSLSRDLLEERARSLLGFSDPKDYVIRLKP